MDEFNPSPEFEEKVRKALEVPNANPEFVKQLRNELARRPVKMKAKFFLKPAWAFAFVIALLTLSGAAYALGRVFGYIPGIGLVENSNGMRVLAEPASMTRDGVTLTVTQALIYSDHVQLVYQVSGITPENDSTTFTAEQLSSLNQSDFCGGTTTPPFTDNDARLRLPDGTFINRVFDTNKYPENVFATKPAFEAVIPADVTELTLVLKCIPWMRLGAVPEDWEVPIKLKYIPAGTIIGEPVLEVTPSEATSVTDQAIAVTLDKVVPQDDLYSFYFSIAPDGMETTPSMLYPASANMIDSTGQQISLVYMQPFPGVHEFSEPWELQSINKPAYGLYTLTMDKIFAYYDIIPVTFEFDAGAAPQPGQVWEIGQTLHLDGADVKVISAKMVERDLADWGLSANTQGFEFSFEAVDGKTPVQLDIMDFNIEHINSGMIFPVTTGDGQPAPKFSIALYYEKGIPAGQIQIAVNRETVMVSGNWTFQWMSPDQTGVNLLDTSNAIASQPGPAGVTAELKRVVKLEDGYLFYIHMNMPEQNPDFRVVSPKDVYVVDSAGKKIKLTLDGPQVHGASDDNVWQFSTTEEIASGPLKVVIEKAEAHYNAFDRNVPPAPDLVAAHSFTFDAGAEPQIGQTWPLNGEFEIGGYRGKVTSVRAVTVNSLDLPFPELRPDRTINSGYEFTIQSLDTAIEWNVLLYLDRAAGSADFVDCIGYLAGDAGSTTTHTVACRGLPASILQVTVYEISILFDGVWEMDWNLPAQ